MENAVWQKRIIWNIEDQGHRVKIRAPGQSGHGPSHIEQLRAQYIYFHKLTMLTVGPAGPLKVAGPLGICPPAPLSAGLLSTCIILFNNDDNI